MIIFLILFYQFYDVASAESALKISIVSKVNPNKVNVGDKFILSTSIKNDGNTTAHITSVDLTLPWEKKSIKMQHPDILKPNKIYQINTQLSIPVNISAGEYNLAILVIANSSDTISYTQMTVNSIQGIALSGEIPLSVIAIIVPGILTYFIIVYFLTQKFDRSYIEMGIVSVSFGILNWSILSVFTGKSVFASLHSLREYIQVFLIAAGLGISVAAVIRASVYIYEKFLDFHKLKEFNKSLTIKGYARTEKPTWSSFMDEQRLIAKKIGKEYFPVLKIALKSDVDNHFPCQTVSGIFEMENNRRQS